MTLIDRMQELLEAERAGVKCLDVMADHASDMGKKELFTLFRNDEGKFCAGLYRLLQARGTVPRSPRWPLHVYRSRARRWAVTPPGGVQVANEFKQIGLLLDDDRRRLGLEQPVLRVEELRPQSGHLPGEPLLRHLVVHLRGLEHHATSKEWRPSAASLAFRSRADSILITASASSPCSRSTL